MLDALSWYLFIQVLGLLAFPIVFVVFRRLPDRGFTLIKPAALVFFSYILWVLGLTHVAPNTQLTIGVILLVTVAPGIFLIWQKQEDIREFIREHWPMLLASEVLFAGFFLMWLGIISEAPSINHTEKPMDFGFMNAVLQSRFFPPEDPWLSGNNISYYYFGHFMMAFMTKATGVASSVGYNVGLALIPALVAIGSFGLVYNLVRLSSGSIKAGILFAAAGPALILLAGNLEGAMEFVHLRGWAGGEFWEWLGIKGLDGTELGTGVFPDSQWWWFRASRVIDTLSGGQSLDYTITEFPMFSFVLGDLHPHVLSLPFVLLALGLTLNFFLSPRALGLTWLRDHALESASLAFFIGSLAFINLWDLPVIAVIFGAAALVKAYGDCKGKLDSAAAGAAFVVVPVLLVGLALFIPFYLDFEATTSGILPLLGVNTRPFLLFLAMGPLIFLTVSFLIRQVSRLRMPSNDDNSAAVLVFVVVAGPFVLWAALASFVTWIDGGIVPALSEIGSRSILVVPGLFFVALAGFSAMQRVRLNIAPATAFPLLLTGLALYLLVGAELFHVVDQFGGGFRRMNTVFKTYYQAWLLLGIVSGYGLYYIWSAQASDSMPRVFNRLMRGVRTVWAGIALLLVVFSFYYPVGAVLDRTGIFQEQHTISDNTLDGLAFLQQDFPSEYAAIQWLRDEAPWGRMIEAVGDDYSDFGRISSSTGLPTVLGWKGHERQWRGSTSSLNDREDDVRTIYTSDDSSEVFRLLVNYDVRYIYLGPRERKTYGDESLAGADKFLRSAFQQDGVIIYEMVRPMAQNR